MKTVDAGVSRSIITGKLLSVFVDGSAVDFEKVHTEEGFAGYGYRWEETVQEYKDYESVPPRMIEVEKECILALPFVFGPYPDRVNAVSAVAGKIRWCDFVRFELED